MDPDKIIEIVKRDPGINQKGIITKLTKRKVANKNTIIIHLKRLVKEKELVERKYKKNMTYVVTDIDITHEELDKRIYHELGTLLESLKSIKGQTPSYRYRVKQDLIDTLQNIDLEKHVQGLEQHERNRINYEPDTLDKLNQVNELIDNLDNTQKFKYRIRKTARKIYDKIASSNRELQEFENKLHHTKNKKYCKWIKEQIEKVNINMSNLWEDFDRIEENIKFENKNKEKTLAEISERYINEKPNVFDQIWELLNKHKNTATVHGLKDTCLVINHEKNSCSGHILQLKHECKDAKSMDEIDEISHDIKQKESTRRELDEKLEMILQYVKADKSLSKLYEQLTKDPHTKS